MSTFRFLDLTPRRGSILPMIMVFLAGAIGFGLVEKRATESTLTTFVKRCPSFSATERVAMRTPEGRIILVNFTEIPEAYLSAFCPDSSALGFGRTTAANVGP